MELRSQKIQLNPNNKQKTAFAKHCGYARVAYNFAISCYVARCEAGETYSANAIKKEFNSVKYAEFPWCQELSQNASKNAIHHFDDALTRYGKGQNKLPKPKKRSGKVHYQADNGVGTVEVRDKRVKLPKIGWVRMCESLRWNGVVRQAHISKRNGKWFVSLLIGVCVGHSDMEQASLFHIMPKHPIGIDVGINTLATCSDDVVYENPRPLQKFFKKLRRANRSQSRKVRYSKNWQKAKKRLQAIHYRIACIREDAHHKATTDIVRRASSIGIETLKITNLLKEQKDSKSVIR